MRVARAWGLARPQLRLPSPPLGRRIGAGDANPPSPPTAPCVGSSSPSPLPAQVYGGRMWQQLTIRPFAGDDHPPGCGSWRPLCTVSIPPGCSHTWSARGLNWLLSTCIDDFPNGYGHADNC